ncbi:MAG: DUF6036 family nucleotidyltransferase [Thermoguttaceae bacterium]|jgi:hypothetical protein
MAAELLIKALQAIWNALRSMNIPAAVMGGLAMSLWKYPRATRDVDLLIGMETRQLDKILPQLQALGIRPKHSPPIMPLGQLNIIQMLYEPPEAFMEVQIDLLLAETDYLRTALERRIPTRLPDVSIETAVLTCEDLILHKLLAGRLIDRADIAALLKLNLASLDRHYLAHWANQLQLVAEIASVWKEILPDEPLPKG